MSKDGVFPFLGVIELDRQLQTQHAPCTPPLYQGWRITVVSLGEVSSYWPLFSQPHGLPPSVLPATH